MKYSCTRHEYFSIVCVCPWMPAGWSRGAGFPRGGFAVLVGSLSVGEVCRAEGPAGQLGDMTC